jgi:beta-galactosidase
MRNPPARSIILFEEDGHRVNRRTFNKLAGFAGIDALAGFIPATASAQTSPSSPDRNQSSLWNRYLLGTAYYPEWWQPSEWETDFRQMQELGINAVRMGEFAWAIFEPAPGQFRFDWMDHAIGIAKSHGVGVVLGTPTASVPPWLYQLHPDVLSGNDHGPYTYGGRKGYCTSSPNYEAACTRIVTALAEHYGENSGVIGWQLDNEPGYPFQAFDPDSERAFRAWLQKRYGTLKELNRVWNGAFWSNEYTEWSQIHFPTKSAEGGWQPAISLAYREFFSDSFLAHLRNQAQILHQRIKNQFVFTNWPAPTWSVNVYTAAAEFLDATAWDNYVSAPGISDFHRQYISSFLSDFSRCAGPHQRFLCAEQNAYVPPNAPSEGLRLQAYMDLAHGAHGHFYFEWRRPLAGNEQFRPSFIKGFNSVLNPAKPTLQKICKELAHIGPRLATAKTHSDIAVLFDFTNQWAQGFGSIGPAETRYDNEVPRYYQGFKILRRNIDVVPLSADLSSYKLILAPNLRMVDDATAQRLIAFVAAGGTLVLNNRAGTQYPDDSMRRMLAPGPFTNIAGVRSIAMLDLTETNPQNGTFDKALESQLGIVFTGSNIAFSPRTIVESLIAEGADVLATVRGGGNLSGHPAITRNHHGNGWVFYVGADSTEIEFYETLARHLADTTPFKPLIDVPHGVEVTSREDGDTTYYFIMNLTPERHDNISLPESMDDIVGDRTNISQLSLEPLGIAVLASRT